MIIKKTADAINAYRKLDVMMSALSEIDDRLRKMRELAIQSAVDAETDEERAALDFVFQSLKKEIDEISNMAQTDTMMV